MKKRGQASGAQAAALIGLILVVLLLYILIMPGENRDELLGTDSSSSSSTTTHTTSKSKINTTILLSENIGRVDFQQDTEYELSLPSFKIYQTTNSQEIKKINPFIIRNGVFDKKTKEESFQITDFENTDNVLLSFNANTRKGVLSIQLNGNTIFENSLESYNVEPVVLPKEAIQDKNTLQFSVSGVGGAFWRTNEYSLENIKITADITDKSRQESKNTFFVEEWKYNSLEKATLKFNPNCAQNSVGFLTVDVNRKNIFTGVPDCGMLNKIVIDPMLLESGTNYVTFKTDAGSYLVDLIKIVLNLKEASYPLYYFEVNSTERNYIENGTKDAILIIKFVDDTSVVKKADLVVNGHKVRIDQRTKEFTRNINTWILEEDNENNYVQIIPKDTLEIINLEVKTQKK